MSSTRRILMQIGIVLFCLWQMFAVAVYAIPREAMDNFSIAMRTLLIPVVTPYMLATSQWQLWNLFSPDPLRRVDYERIEAFRHGAWFPVATISPNDYSIWRHATYSKLFANVFNEFDKSLSPAQIRLMQLLACKPYDLPAGTMIRLVYEYYVIPPGLKDWSTWKPTVTGNLSGPQTVCPASVGT